MREQNIKIGIVGSGHMARVHARHWTSIPEVSIAGIASHDPSPRIPGYENTPLYPSLTDMLNVLPDLDVIDICTPTPSHLSLAIEAIDAQKHVFLEKPATRTLEECDELIARASKSKSKVMVGHVVRYFPEFANAHAQVKNGLVGIPAAIRTARLMGKSREGFQDWYNDESLSGGLILDVLVHDFDWLLWTIGDIDRVYAKSFIVDESSQNIDYALITLHHKNGALSHVTGSRVHGSFQTTFEICGDSGMIEHDSAKSASLSVLNKSSRDTMLKSPMAPNDDPYYRELRNFIDSILNDSQSPISLSDARSALRVALAAIESAETGQPVELS